MFLISSVSFATNISVSSSKNCEVTLTDAGWGKVSSIDVLNLNTMEKKSFTGRLNRQARGGGVFRLFELVTKQGMFSSAFLLFNIDGQRGVYSLIKVSNGMFSDKKEIICSNLKY